MYTRCGQPQKALDIWQDMNHQNSMSAEIKF
jgi:pentatricopeptide repeat protein